VLLLWSVLAFVASLVVIAGFGSMLWLTDIASLVLVGSTFVIVCATEARE
jgi:hypothetical protein